MPHMSLTDFVDVVSKSGTPKGTKVADLKNRPPYNPAFDFYRAVRDHIVKVHENGSSKAALNAVLGEITDRKKTTAYPEIVAGYRKWWGNKTLVWLDPATGSFSRHGVDVSVNPELGLEVDGKKHLIKMYFKADPLAKNRIDIITHLMAVVLSSGSQKGSTMSVLDVRRSKLISPTVPIAHLNAVLDAELAYVAALWKQL